MKSVWVLVIGWVMACDIAVAQSSSGKSVSTLNEKASRVLSAQPDSAFIYASQALDITRESGDRLDEGQSHQTIGMVFYEEGVYLQALDHLLKAEAIFRDLDKAAFLGATLNQQGLVYYNIGQPEKALSIHQQALKSYESIGDKSGIAYSLGSMGRLYEKRGEYKASLEYQFKALDIYKVLGDQQGEATILENMGSILEDQDDYPGALEYFRRSLKLDELTGDSLGMVVNLNNVGDNYRKTGNYEQAIIETNRALALAKRLHNRYQVSSAYKDLSKSYHLAGDDVRAFENLETGRSLYEEIFAQDALRQIALLQTLFDMERKNNAIQQLKNEQKLDMAIRIALAAGIALVVLLAAIIIRRQRSRMIRNHDENSRSMQVYEAKGRLMEAELENTHLRETTLQQELSSHSRLLSTQTLHIMGKNKMMEDIQQKLSDLLGEEREEQRRKIKSVLKMIDNNFVQDKEWEDFNKIFGQVHKDFFEKLSMRSKDLTSSDLRLAALIRLQMTSRDIASTLGISMDSLRIARYRLKKRLALGDGENLASYIHAIT